MSLSLSSLLNPSPESETRRDDQQQQAPPKESLPPIQYVQSPEEQHQRSPNSARSNQHQFTYPSSTTQEAAQALAKLSASPAAPPQQWNGYSAQDQNGLERTRSWETRPSGYGDPIQLPPPSATGSRKMSSPTLDQYHVASRSPEQRRASIVSPPQNNITLPPIQNFAHPSDQTRRESQAHVEAHASSSLHSGPQETAKLQLSPSQSKPQTTITEEHGSSPAAIKQESAATPQPPSSPTEARRPSEIDVKAVAALKNEHGLRTQSPLRESSVPVPTTEMVPEQQPTVPKKRPAPSKTKKGTATTMKKEKAPPAKKRKVELKRSATPSSRASKVPTVKGSSTKGTPVNSSPAPSNRSYSGEPNEEQYDDDDDEEMDEDADGDEYCVCRKPDSGTFMIGCDGTCDDWYHGKCVGIQERDKNLIDKYICPSCEKGGKSGRTTWKRMCRRGGCRQPARVGKTKSGSNGSKYCSDECGVVYFREMVARSRGREDSAKNPSSRRKLSITEKTAADDDLGARGGALSAGEVKALLHSSKTVDEFRKLGDGVLSPPATPDGQDKCSEFTEPEQETLQRIQKDKEVARRRHATLKDRLKFVTLVKQAASRTAAEKELKPKEYCGYDPRIEWTEQRFQTWRNGKAGQQAFELETLQPADKEENGKDEDEDLDICDRKKCARHMDWNKLAVDDLRFEMQDNGDRMRALDREEKEVKERAALRAKAGKIEGEGSVEVHGLGITTQAPALPAAINGETMVKTNGVLETVEDVDAMVLEAA